MHDGDVGTDEDDLRRVLAGHARFAVSRVGIEPPKEGDTFRNPDLAALLQTLAEQNSVEPFT